MTEWWARKMCNCGVRTTKKPTISCGNRVFESLSIYDTMRSPSDSKFLEPWPWFLRWSMQSKLQTHESWETVHQRTCQLTLYGTEVPRLCPLQDEEILQGSRHVVCWPPSCSIHDGQICFNSIYLGESYIYHSLSRWIIYLGESIFIKNYLSYIWVNHSLSLTW